MSRTNPAHGSYRLRENGLYLRDTTLHDATTARHGFLPKLPGGTTTFLRADGTFATPSASSGSSEPEGWAYEVWGRRIHPGMTALSINALRTYTLTGASSAQAEDVDGVYTKFGTGAVSGNKVQWIASILDTTRTYWYPEFVTNFKTDSDISSLRIWAGFFGVDPSASDTPSGHFVGFRYSTGASDTTWQCATRDGTTQGISDSGVTVAANTKYVLRILCEPSQVTFYINDTLVATRTTNLPTSSVALGENLSFTTLTAAARFGKWSRLWLRHRH